jgi:hypothetical protein
MEITSGAGDILGPAAATRPYLYVGSERAQRRLPATDGDWIEAVLETVVLPEAALTDWPIASP